VSRLCAEIDGRVQTFLRRPIEGEWPYLWLDATYVKARRDHHIVSVAVIVAMAVNTDGRREVLGMTIGNSKAAPFWTEFLRSLTRRALRGVKLVISDAHEGLKSAITKVLSATWQRCRVHFMRNALAHAEKTQRRIVSAWIGTAFAQDDAAAARKQWRQVADQARPRVSKLTGPRTCSGFVVRRRTATIASAWCRSGGGRFPSATTIRLASRAIRSIVSRFFGPTGSATASSIFGSTPR
jgi:putative transposase